MAFQTTPGVGQAGIALGFFRVNARYNVRGRRADTLPITIRVNMMSEDEQKEALRILEEKRLFRLNLPSDVVSERIHLANQAANRMAIRSV